MVRVTPIIRRQFNSKPCKTAEALRNGTRPPSTCSKCATFKNLISQYSREQINKTSLAQVVTEQDAILFGYKNGNTFERQRIIDQEFDKNPAVQRMGLSKYQIRLNLEREVINKYGSL